MYEFSTYRWLAPFEAAVDSRPDFYGMIVSPHGSLKIFDIDFYCRESLDCRQIESKPRGGFSKTNYAASAVMLPQFIIFIFRSESSQTCYLGGEINL
jgi:hypothetical protein